MQNFRSTYTADASISGAEIDFKTEIVTENGLVDIGDIKKEPESNNFIEAVTDIYYQIEMKSEDMHQAIDIKNEDVSIAESQLNIGERNEIDE